MVASGSSKSRLPDARAHNFGLDVFRSLAIILVLASHGEKYMPSFLAAHHTGAFWSLGVMGVELFYALSGFLIGRILIDIYAAGAGWNSLKTFMIRRWMRTLPLYYLTLVALLLLPMLDPAPRADIWSYFVMGQNLLSPMPVANWFGPSWSLVIEEWSYLLLPLLAFGFCRSWRHPVAGGAVILVVAGLFLRLLLTYPTDPWDETVRKTVLTRVDAIAYGVLLASMWHRVGAAAVRRWACWLAPISLVVIISTFMICADRNHAPYYLQGFYSRILMLPLTGLALAGCLPLAMNWSLPKALEAPVKLIARLSYAMYLVHWPFLFILRDVPHQFQLVVYLAGTLITSALLSYGIEQPILRARPHQRLLVAHSS